MRGPGTASRTSIGSPWPSDVTMHAVASDRRRRILRFFGPRGDLLAAESPGLVVYDSFGRERLRTEVEGFLDIASVGDELWAVTPRTLVRLSALDGSELGREPLEYLDPAGRFMQSSTAPQLPVWHSAQPAMIRGKPARSEIPGPGGEMIVPIADGRWLLWQNGQLRLWRTIGEAWRRQIGDPGSRAVDAQLVLDGRLFVLAQRRTMDETGELRLSVVATNDGAQTTQLRIPSVSALAFAARRGLAITRTNDRLSVIDVRFGRWLRDLALPAGVTEFAVDEGMQWIALASSEGLELVRPDTLVAPPAPDPAIDSDGDGESESTRRSTNGHNGHATAPVAVEVVPQEPAGTAPEPEPAPAPIAPDEPFGDAPLVRLVPVSVTTTATAAEIKQYVDLRLQWIGAKTAVAIANAWDNGRHLSAGLDAPAFRVRGRRPARHRERPCTRRCRRRERHAERDGAAHARRERRARSSSVADRRLGPRLPALGGRDVHPVHGGRAAVAWRACTTVRHPRQRSGTAARRRASRRSGPRAELRRGNRARARWRSPAPPVRPRPGRRR